VAGDLTVDRKRMSDDRRASRGAQHRDRRLSSLEPRCFHCFETERLCFAVACL
jgi:hypothetical protein